VPRRAALLNGRPIVSFGVVRSTGTNMVDVEKRVDAALERLRASLPADVHIDKLQTDTKWVMESYQSSVESLVLGAALAVLVIWLFLRDWRAAMISALAMPLSVIPTFAALKWAGFTLNSMSLLGFALVVGILVDDAIVEIENIVRHIHMGKSSRTAALEAADEIGLAVVATTATIVVVFLPVAFMGGIPGQYFKQFGLTVAVAVFFSLLVARLLTPMMAAWWLREPRHEANRDRSLLTRTYDAMLEWAMANRLATVMMAVGFFVFSLMLFQNMPTSLFSDSDVGITSVSLEQPPGASLDQMLSATRRACDILQGHPDVDKVIARIGDGAAVNSASITVVLKPRESRQKTQQQIEDELRPALSRISGTRASFGNADSFRGKIKIVLASDDGEALTRAADALTDEMRGLPGLFDVRSTAALTQPEIVVRPDVALAAEQGVSVATIARTAMIATMGDIDQNLARFDLPDRQIYIRVQLDPKWRGNIQAIRDLKVVGSGGRLVPLSAVAEVTMGQGPSQIDRYDRHRQVSVSASLAPGFTLGDADAAVHKLAAMKNLPAGVFDVASGALEVQRDVFGGFVWAMGSAVLFIYAVLVLLFSDFLQPLTIMVPLPLSIGGALMGLMAAHQSLGFFSLIGIVMLMGLATKNSILLVEYALMAMHEGQLRDRAIIESGEARMRPILMTTIAMIAGMLPIALGIGAGSEARSPMAIAVVGGLVTSTLLTLIVVPVVFTYVDDFRQWARRLLFRDR
jgi:multidrug efflux pump subunit AcrB